MSNHPSLDEIIRAIPARLVVQLAETDKNLSKSVEELKASKKKLSNSEVRKIVQAEIRRISGKILTETMTTKQRAAVVASLDIDHEKQGNNPKSSLVHKKRLLENVEEGVLDFLKENVEEDMLVEIGEAFELELSAKEGAEKLAAILTNQIEFEAAIAFLESFPNDVLLDIAFEMKLCDATETAATGTVVEAIVTQTEIKELKKPAPKKKKVKISKSKPKIAKGVSYDDLFQWYTVDELREFAKDNELLVSGSKKDLIKRIIAWFDGDKENTTQEGLKAKKEALKAKKEASAAKKAKKNPKSKKASKKSGDEEEEKPAKETKPKETKPKETKPKDTKETKPNKETEAAEEELDLDNLEKYSVDVLKNYCQDEAIEVSGKTKKAYIDAILKYNEEGDQ